MEPLSRNGISVLITAEYDDLCLAEQDSAFEEVDEETSEEDSAGNSGENSAENSDEDRRKKAIGSAEYSMKG